MRRTFPFDPRTDDPRPGRRPPSRGFLRAAAAVVAVVAVAACAPSPAPPATSPTPDRPSAVTIEHQFGTTEISGVPQRVVSVGFNDHDTLLALGTVPVGVRDWYGDQPSATWPWARDELGDARPTVLGSDQIDVEAVAALRPDLIVGIYSGMTEQEYGLLSRVAPTIAQPAQYQGFGTPWREVTRTYGRALGVPQRAEQVVADVDARLAAAREAQPEFAGAEATVTFFAEGQLGAYTSQDLRSRLLADLGFTVPAEVDAAAGEGGFYAPISPEQADLVDRDVLVWITSTPAEVDAVRALPVRDTLAAAREGREVFLPFDLNGAMSFSSPLSIPYLLDGLVPELRAAVDGDPATPVPSAAGA